MAGGVLVLLDVLPDLELLLHRVRTPVQLLDRELGEGGRGRGSERGKGRRNGVVGSEGGTHIRGVFVLFVSLFIDIERPHEVHVVNWNRAGPSARLLFELEGDRIDRRGERGESVRGTLSL